MIKIISKTRLNKIKKELPTNYAKLIAEKSTKNISERSVSESTIYSFFKTGRAKNSTINRILQIAYDIIEENKKLETEQKKREAILLNKQEC